MSNGIRGVGFDGFCVVAIELRGGFWEGGEVDKDLGQKWLLKSDT